MLPLRPGAERVGLRWGRHHDDVASSHGDRAKASARIVRYGYRVIRFWNNEVTENLDGVLLVVVAALEGSPPHPGPLRPTGAEREIW
jgi:hypothetical protein